MPLKHQKAPTGLTDDLAIQCGAADPRGFPGCSGKPESPNLKIS